MSSQLAAGKVDGRATFGGDALRFFQNDGSSWTELLQRRSNLFLPLRIYELQGSYLAIFEVDEIQIVFFPSNISTPLTLEFMRS